MMKSKDQLISVEQMMIDSYRAADRKYGYNSRPTAHSNLGHRFSEETRQKIRVANLGSKKSDETRAKMSVASKGKKKSAEHRVSISSGKMGISRPSEMVRRLAEKFRSFDDLAVLAIRKDRRTGMTYRAIASKYSSDQATIFNVINGVGMAYAFK